MSSLNASAVAHRVLQKVAKGEKVNFGKIIKSQGYGDVVSRRPEKVKRTKSYQSIMLPAIKNMEEERNEIILAMKGKDKNSEKYATLLSGLDILTKNIQLLSGKATDNVAMVIQVSEAIAKKNATQKEQDVNKSDS